MNILKYSEEIVRESEKENVHVCIWERGTERGREMLMKSYGEPTSYTLKIFDLNINTLSKGDLREVDTKNKAY